MKLSLFYFLMKIIPKFMLFFVGDDEGFSFGGEETPDNNGGEETPPENTPQQPDIDWRASLGLDEDTIKHPVLQKYKSAGDVVKALINAQSLIGAEKLAIPPKDAKPEVWNEVFKKLGLPDKIENYKLDELKVPDGVDPLDQDFVNDMKSKAFELGILPNQLNPLFKWYMERAFKIVQDGNQQKKESFVNTENELKKQYGYNYDTVMKNIQGVVDSYGDDGLKKMLPSIKSNLPMMKFLANIAENFSPDSITSKGTSIHMTPKEAQAEIDRIMADPKNPYFDEGSPAHQSALDRMFALTAYANPAKP